MNRIKIVILFSILLFFPLICNAEIQKVEIKSEWQEAKYVQVATCPICGKINSIDRNNRFRHEKCKHFIKTEKFMFFDKTDVKKKEEEISILKEKIDLLEMKIISLESQLKGYNGIKIKDKNFPFRSQAEINNFNENK